MENSSDEVRENTPLLTDGNQSSYATADGNQISYATSNSSSHQSEAASFDFRAQGPPVPQHVTPEEVLHRLKYAFRNEGFDAENDVEAAQHFLNTIERSAFKDKVLDNLKETPMSMKDRMNIRRLIYRKSHTRRRGERYVEETSTKTGNINRSFIPFNLWEDTISNLSAYFGSNVASYFKFLRILLFLNVCAGIIMICFATVPQAIEGPFNYNSSTHQFGVLSDTLLFYGSYGAEKVSGIYNEPLAFILTWMAVSLFYLIVIVIAMQIRYRRSKLSDRQDDYDFAMRTFCSWDFTIHSKEGVNQRRQALVMDFKERIREEFSAKVVSLQKRFMRYLGRFISNIVVLCLYGGSGYLIYYVAHDFSLPDDTPSSIKDLFDKNQLSVITALLKFFVPIIFELLIHIEGYSPRKAQNLTLFRTTLFYLAGLVVFDISLYNVASECTTTSCHEKSFNVTTSCCWENRVGEEVLKVVFIDLGLCVAAGVFFHMGKALLIKCNGCIFKLELSEFAITSSVLDLIYGQGLVWLGLYFSPLIIVLGIVKLILVFYTRLYVAKIAMVAPRKVFRASRSGNFYLFILMLNWFVCILPTAYTIAEISPSADCGPFRKVCKAYDVITDNIGTWPTWLEDAVKYIATAAVVVPVLILLLLIALYYRTKSSSYSDLIKDLKNQLIFERKVEKRRVFATALSTPYGTASKATGKALGIKNTNLDL